MPRDSWGVVGTTTWPLDGGGYGKIDCGHGGSAVCEQSTWADCADTMVCGARVSDWNRCGGGFGDFTGARSNEGRTCGCNGQGATRIRGTNPQRARLTNCLDTGNSRSGSCKAACGRGQGAVRLFSHAPVDCGISVCHPCSSEFSFADDYEVSQEDAGRGRAVGVAQPGRFVATNFCVGGCTFHRNSHDGFRRNNGRELSANGVDVDERSTAG